MRPKKIHYYLSLFLVVQILLVSWFSNNPDLIETYYSEKIYVWVSSFFRILLGWIPFSVGDLLLFLIVIIAIRFLYITFKSFRKSWLLRMFQITSFISVLYFCFYFFWGLNYFRHSLAKNLGFQQKKYTTSELISLNNTLLQKVNKAHLFIVKDSSEVVQVPHTQHEMYGLAVKAFEKLAKKHPRFEYKYPSVKSSLMSLIQTYNGTSGYINPLTGEAQVNDKIPLTGYPTTICHELSHQVGYAAENEANFIGFLAASYSKDSYFQYSAYRMALRYSLYELYKRDKEEYKKIISEVNPGVLKDFNNSSKFWQAYKNPFEPLLKKGYNSYLKANNQQQGIKSYNYVVDLLISYYTTIKE